MTAISWLCGQSKSFRPYVACRVGEITTDFDPNKDIAYVPSGLNIIDLFSRGVGPDEMLKVIDGPSFLQEPPVSWPETPINISVDRGDVEQKKFHVRNAKVLAVSLTKDKPFVDPKKFSSWSRLLMVTARVLSLKDLPKRLWLKELMKKLTEWPSFKYIKAAEVYWIRQSQKDIDFENHQIMKLNPFLDENERVYRVGGRIHNAPLSYDIRHPYLLPKKSHISLLIAQERHKHAVHCGHLRTATEVRKNYWIIGDTNLCRRVTRQCTVCRRYKGKSLHQQMADLPDFRVKPCTPPFQATVVDYLGPVHVKLTRNTVSKGYCAVFTCTVTRAVHLTCVQDLSTSAFLQALERFVSIRGAPALILSDNATCFRGADNEIRELQLRLDQSQVRSKCLKFNTQWKFGPPGGPHHQGTVERMVQEVKKSMRHIVRADKLSFVEWETIFTQISALLNSRPLTALSSSPLDDPPLTPNHFLIGRGDLPCPQVPCDDYIGDARKRRELCNSMVDGFWRRWMTNIQKLSPCHKWSSARENLVKGDVVLVIEDNAARGQWKMAKVMEVYPGSDNLIRVVDVKRADGHVLKRPVTKLILFMKRDERLDK